ncbi:hypothetical protein M514_08169 [Trichuris suis]|uniref:Uncharacterized protein n=1 Tax=Trichuris suis TaxID=68888 RepID=A0A085NR20_9BILA|nr:hypothetical protein M513_08169 [Trichuris suis]KFD71916.1 hypothetical protein M514_08169 [Trichuris suis]
MQHVVMLKRVFLKMLAEVAPRLKKVNELPKFARIKYKPARRPTNYAHRAQQSHRQFTARFLFVM